MTKIWHVVDSTTGMHLLRQLSNPPEELEHLVDATRPEV